MIYIFQHISLYRTGGSRCGSGSAIYCLHLLSVLLPQYFHVLFISSLLIWYHLWILSRCTLLYLCILSLQLFYLPGHPVSFLLKALLHQGRLLPQLTLHCTLCLLLLAGHLLFHPFNNLSHPLFIILLFSLHLLLQLTLPLFLGYNFLFQKDCPFSLHWEPKKKEGGV